jgi:hypothetical protein
VSAIAQTDWLLYLRPSVGSRPTVKVCSPNATASPELSKAARDPRLLASHAAIDRLSVLPQGWDSHNSPRPSPFAVERARQLLEDAFGATSKTTGWQAPYISASEEGEIALEWWNGQKNLTIYVGPQHSTFLKSWGPHIVDEMTDGVLTDNWDPALWAWLFG